MGLLGLRDFKVFLFTATLTEYYRESWRRAFQANRDAIRTFPTQHQVKENVEYQQDVKVSLRRNKHLALQSMLDEVKLRMEREPLLVFVANDDEQSVEALEAMMSEYSGVIPFNKVLTRGNADMVHANAPSCDKGVFFMKTGFGRGTDFRFAKPAFVLILDYDDFFRASNVVQMVGRSSRTQGIQSGQVFCNAATIMRAEVDIEHLLSKEKQLGSDLGPNIC